MWNWWYDRRADSNSTESKVRMCGDLFEMNAQKLYENFATLTQNKHHGQLVTGRMTHVDSALWCSPASLANDDKDVIAYISSVTPIVGESEYVKLEVNGNHRFALASGVLTHNCVTIAEEMEQNGIPGCVVISQATYDEGASAAFECEQLEPITLHAKPMKNILPGEAATTNTMNAAGTPKHAGTSSTSATSSATASISQIQLSTGSTSLVTGRHISIREQLNSSEHAIKTTTANR